MKRFLTPSLLFGALLAAPMLPAATTIPADNVKAAIKNLADAPNYSWTVTQVETSPGPPPITPIVGSSVISAPPEGKSEKGGYSILTSSTTTSRAGVAHTTTASIVSKGDKWAKEMPNGTWITPEEMLARIPAGLPAADRATIIAPLTANPLVIPADELASLASKINDFKSADGVMMGDLPSDYIAAQLLTRLSGSTFATPPFTPTDTSGTLKIWLTNGVPAKYEVHVRGTATTPNGRSEVVDFTRTIEIKDIGVTKLDVPAAAVAKLEGVPATPAPATVPLPVPATAASTTPPGPVPPLPLTDAQKAILQGPLADFVSQFATATGIKLVPIPAGSYTMGSPAGEVGHEDEEGPQTQVNLTRNFLLGATDVTQGQYEAVMGTNPSHFKAVGQDAPVEQVSWDDAVAFCQKLTERERAAGRLPAGYTFTLPTEAQWEYACRAGTTGPYAGDFNAMAWYEWNSDDKTHPVGMKQPNAWGLYDMHGNVLEWCLDYWSDHHPGGEVTDPTGPVSGTEHICRGGCYSVPADTCTSAMRVSFAHDDRENNIGFRIAVITVAKQS